MKSTRWMLRSICGMALFALSGCMSYGPYGYGQYPGYYNSPSQGYVMPPGTMMAPGTTYPTPNLGPSTGSPGTWNPNMQPTPATPGSSSMSPTFSNPVPNGARKPADSIVPDPQPIPGSGASSTGGTLQPTPQNTPLGGDNSDSSFGKGTQLTPLPRSDAPAQSVATVGSEDNFQAPVERAQSPNDSPDSTKPYAYEPKSYSWLRGTVDYNPQDKSWQIMYNKNPDPNDPYGGAFCLMESPKLSGLHDGDSVYVEGRLNTQQPGKPRYEIDAGIVRIVQQARTTASQSVGN